MLRLCVFTNVYHVVNLLTGLPCQLGSKEFACRRCRFDPWFRKILWRRKWQPTPVFLPGTCHGQSSLGGATVHGVKKESDTAEWLNKSNKGSTRGGVISLRTFSPWLVR